MEMASEAEMQTAGVAGENGKLLFAGMNAGELIHHVR
jgi:hypothetical protein